MNSEDLLELAQKIYALDVILHPDWDLQKKARESIKTAMQFFLAVRAEQAQGSSLSESPARNHSPQASSMQMAQPDMSMSQPPLPPPPPGSTSHTAPPADKGSPAEAKKFRKMEPAASTGLHQTQSQQQSEPPARHVQVAHPYPPVRQ